MKPFKSGDRVMLLDAPWDVRDSADSTNDDVYSRQARAARPYWVGRSGTVVHVDPDDSRLGKRGSIQILLDKDLDEVAEHGYITNNFFMDPENVMYEEVMIEELPV